MYGLGYEVLLILLLAVVLLVGIPLSVVLRRSGLLWWKILPAVILSSWGVLVLSVIVSTVVAVRLASNGASAPSPKPVNPRALRPRRWEPPFDSGWPVGTWPRPRRAPGF